MTATFEWDDRALGDLAATHRAAEMMVPTLEPPPAEEPR